MCTPMANRNISPKMAAKIDVGQTQDNNGGVNLTDAFILKTFSISTYFRFLEKSNEALSFKSSRYIKFIC